MRVQSGARAWLVGALLACGLPVVGGCAEASTEPHRGGTIVIGAGSDLDHANPLVSVDAWTSEVLRFALFTPLVRYGPDLEYVPALAESWELAGDTGVTFHLRRDVRWHDGTPTTADDVLFTFERARDPATGFPNADYFSRWTGGVAVDSYTVRFTFEPHAEPLAGWPFTPIAPRHLLDTVPAAAMRQAAFNRHPVGNGPFRFVSQRSNDRWVLEANADHPEGLGGPPLVDRFIWRVIPENSAQLAELRAGEADLILQPRPEQVREHDGRNGIRTIVKPSRAFDFIVWNGKRPGLDDPRVRRALAMALDRAQIVEAFRRGYGQIPTGPIMPFHWSYDPAVRPLPYAPDSAAALLARAGIEDRNGDGRLELEDGDPFRIELKLVAGNEYSRDLAEVVRGDLEAVGVVVETRPTEATTLFAEVTSPDRDFDAALLAWDGDFRLDLRDTFHSRALGGPYQFASYENAEADSLMDRATAEPDRAVAGPLWRRVQEILNEQQPWTLLAYRTDAFLARERLSGVEMDIRGAFVNLPDWWVTRDAPADSVAVSGGGRIDGK